MPIERIAGDRAPAAIGPYSQGIKAGDFVFFSGQIPLDPQTGEVVSGGIKEQTEQVMNNMKAVLGAADLSFAQVVKTTIYLTDLSQFSLVNEIYGRYFGDPPPARATVQVAALPRGAAVEIEWIAYGGR
ncbi:endoribonuclease L-PSP [Geoalkalibacter ferrihydriticus]|uniref:Endoribonuclease L-PSP n=2 Tax=Geoalkalibacter ferrihydriticus TaxID=392333 RepID=A0A0C2HVK1_9BACT|nr:RidA family protein [Geoalkalibacter ferrihydriticus]KIH76767.1 endoribonuclease L-PSP [Geoalkalibacter ferrihydriticus DSM 17813]SDL52505.1 endoribonuclease L-PSP [Geoalkalibacter ferrihydriticus]